MTTTIEESKAGFIDNPDSGKVAPKAVAALANGRARVSSGPFNWDVDLPPVVGGGNQAPSPTAYLLGALAACAVAFVNDTLAPEFDVVLDDLSAEARCTTDIAGLVGVDGVDPRLFTIGMDVTITSSSPAENIEALKTAWLARCPIYLALSEPNDVDVTFHVERSAS
jgi:uncharacterized OsmC-like protein